MTRKKRPVPVCRAPDRLVLEEECEAITTLSRMTRWRKEQEGTFPRRIQITNNRVAWLESELMAWMQERAAERGRPAALYEPAEEAEPCPHLPAE